MEQTEFEHIAKDLRSRALAVGRGFGLDADEAEDIAQDTLLKMWAMRSELARYRSLQALAATIARNLCVSNWRRKRTVAIEGRQMADDISSRPDLQLEASDNDRWLEQRLQALPSTEYQVLHLRQVERKSNEEIAAIIGITPLSVSTLLSRARRKLLSQIKKRNS